MSPTVSPAAEKTLCPNCQRPQYERRTDVVPREGDNEACRAHLHGGPAQEECRALALARLVSKEVAATEPAKP